MDGDCNHLVQWVKSDDQIRNKKGNRKFQEDRHTQNNPSLVLSDETSEFLFLQRAPWPWKQQLLRESNWGWLWQIYGFTMNMSMRSAMTGEQSLFSSVILYLFSRNNRSVFISDLRDKNWLKVKQVLCSIFNFFVPYYNICD